MKPRIATSFRSHGKWGDFLACIVPTIWCYNILVNSSFIMRLAEWQNESSLFSVRVRGKQWYWVYKFELKTVIDLLSVPKNLGWNKWVLNTIGSYESTDNYFYALKLRSQNMALKNYWNNYLKELEKLNELSCSVYLDNFSFDKNKTNNISFVNAVLNNSLSLTKNATFNNSWNFDFFSNESLLFLDDALWSKQSWNTKFKLKLRGDKSLSYSNFFNFFFKIKNPIRIVLARHKLRANLHIIDPMFEKMFWRTHTLHFRWGTYIKHILFNTAIFRQRKDVYLNAPARGLGILVNRDHILNRVDNFNSLNLVDFFLNKELLKEEEKFINLNFKKAELLETSRFLKNRVLELQPILVFKPNLSSLHNQKSSTSVKMLADVSFNKESAVEKKFLTEQYYMIIKQKRYKRKKNIPLRIRHEKNYEGKPIKKDIKFSDRPYLTIKRVLSSLHIDPTKLYRALRKNKLRHENISIQFSRRMLRTKKVLVLPVNINLTIISNSYDVVHSWFLPALGVKIDCVPGRATHHSFYCDNVGFYYGQCAEICGRYHHHMPIRLCILTFDQFLVWWYHFGLPKLLFTKPKNRYETSYVQKTFCW